MDRRLQYAFSEAVKDAQEARDNALKLLKAVTEDRVNNPRDGAAEGASVITLQAVMANYQKAEEAYASIAALGDAQAAWFEAIEAEPRTTLVNYVLAAINMEQSKTHDREFGMRIQEVLKRVRAMGFKFKTRNPERVIRSTMQRLHSRGELIKTHMGKYRLADRVDASELDVKFTGNFEFRGRMTVGED